MKIVLVDDERIAIEHIKDLIPWERHGYEIAATATNGRSALRICEELRPQLMIVDIRMPVMDGLALIQAVAERRLGIKCIVMSAYEDFEYARKAIALGCVSGYLIKHEVDAGELLLALNRAKDAWLGEEAQRRLARSEQLRELAIGVRGGDGSFFPFDVKPPCGLAMFQADAPFTAVPSDDRHPDGARIGPWVGDAEPAAMESPWRPIASFSDNGCRFTALFALADLPAGRPAESFREALASLQADLRKARGMTFSAYYTGPIDRAAELPAAFRLIERASRHAVFCGREALARADDLPLPRESAPPRKEAVTFQEIEDGMESRDPEEIESAVNRLFRQVTSPIWDLGGLIQAVSGLTALWNARRALAGLPDVDPFDPRDAEPLYDLQAVCGRFRTLMADFVREPGEKAVSPKLMRALRYMREHFATDITIEDVAYRTGISPSYLHLLFKRELKRTFLDCLTELRMRQAKLILRHEDAKMADVCERVGYRSPQHFSQVFKRWTGMLPHEYREGGRRP